MATDYDGILTNSRAQGVIALHGAGIITTDEARKALGYDAPPVPIFDADAQKAAAREFTPSDVLAAIRDALPATTLLGVFPHGSSGVSALFADSRYYCLHQDAWDAILAATVDRNKYIPERFDCDKFARWWDGVVGHNYEVNGKGIVLDFSGEHAYNIVFVWNGDGKTPSLTARFMEPQENKFVDLGSHHHILTRGVIII